TGEKVEDDSPQTIWAKTTASHASATAIIAFEVKKPANLTWPEILQNLKTQSYIRVLVPAANKAPAAHRVDDLLADARLLKNTAQIFVAQDRVALTPENKSRFLEATETALHFGQGQVRLFAADTLAGLG